MKKYFLNILIFSISLIAILLIIFYKFIITLAFFSAIVLLLPPLIWSIKTRFVTLISICSIAFLTQIITLPFFYLNADDFLWGNIKPFRFSVYEAISILINVTIFLLSLIIFFKYLYKFTFFGGSVILEKNKIKTVFRNLNLKYLSDNSNSKNTHIYITLFILLIMFLVPLNLWMFSQGVSIVGVQPPQLPYHLSGVLHYFTKFLIPLTLAYLYSKTRRNLFTMVILVLYGLLLGLTSISRSSLMFILLPILYFSLYDLRKWQFIFVCFFSLIAFAMVTEIRNYVYILNGSVIAGNFSNSLFIILLEMVTDPKSKIFEITSIFKVIITIFNRIDGFDNLVMSEYYDIYKVNSPIDLILGQVWHGFSTVDLDLHHIQWQGNILPDGFVNGGGLFSNIVILGNASLWWIILCALMVSAILIFLEKGVIRLKKNINCRNNIVI